VSNDIPPIKIYKSLAIIVLPTPPVYIGFCYYNSRERFVFYYYNSRERESRLTPLGPFSEYLHRHATLNS